MYLDVENAIIAKITGAIPNAPVLDTFDIIDFTEDGASRIAVQVRWMGFSVDGQATNAAHVLQRFEVAVLVDAARAMPDERAAAASGLLVIVSRLLGLEISRGQRLTLAGDTPPPDFDGMALRLAVYFNFPGVITAVR